MRVYVCFDDTDVLGADRGTGKLVRWFTERLPEGCTTWGVVRQQLIVHPDVPYTSHNSSGCAVIDVPDASFLPGLAELGAAHIAEHFMEGSDPGLCVAPETADFAPLSPSATGRRSRSSRRTTRARPPRPPGCTCPATAARTTASSAPSPASGLTAGGWAGRFVDYRVPLRGFSAITTVGEVEAAGITVVAVDRNVMVPKPDRHARHAGLAATAPLGRPTRRSGHDTRTERLDRHRQAA